MSNLKGLNIDIVADNIDVNTKQHLPIHMGARAVIIKDESILLIYEQKNDMYTLPGGRIENHESPLDTVKREVKEETGYRIKNAKPTLVIHETFEDSKWQHHIFLCDIDKRPTTKALTQAEKAIGFKNVCLPIKEALAVLSNHEPKTFHPHHQNILKRELIALIHSL